MPRTTIQNTQFYPPVVWRNASRDTRYSIRDTRYAIRDTKYVRRSTGSALILAVVLTSLLAVIAVAFLLNSRMDSIATSAIAENKELNFAVDTVIAKISEQLVADTPHTDANGVPIEEYYDYPDALNPWLASLEPYTDVNDACCWHHISDVYRNLGPLAYNIFIGVVRDYQPTIGPALPADADGDGVLDSRWVYVPGITSGKGKPIYAAIRIIDNSAMLNVNTAYRFDPNTAALADGSSQSSINLLGLSWRDLTHSFIARNQRLLSFRAGLTPDPNNIPAYEQNVVWNYDTPTQMYTPFDISDELKLRNRYQINYNLMVSRIEELWESCFDGPFYVPRRLGDKLEDWFWKANYSSLDPNLYDYRHIATTDNLDRVVTPRGAKMLNVNTAEETGLFDTVKTALAETTPGDVNLPAAQITANLIDYRDIDDHITTFYDPNFLAAAVYGFEQPCVYISEVVQSFVREPNSPLFRSYAIELYKPYSNDTISEPNKWKLRINNLDGSFQVVDVNRFGDKAFQVIWKTDVNAPLDINLVDVNVFNDVNVVFDGGSSILLQRDVNGFPLTVDEVVVPSADPCIGWFVESNDVNLATHSIERDITPHKCIRRLWAPPTSGSSLGGSNFYFGPGPMLQAHPANARFTNVGEIGALFRVPAHQIGFSITADELNTRLNLADPRFQHLFKYLTVIDPAQHTPDPNETRIKGRININTAPWFVLAQLPWVTPGLAQTIVAYRDTVKVPPGYGSIGELMQVIAADPCSSIDAYARDSNDLFSLPDLTPNDHAINDFEERDVIFARISNLVTVRSDVFTAYILVRIGRDGPQKRVVAILDRSEVKTPADRVRVIALHPVADPR